MKFPADVTNRIRIARNLLRCGVTLGSVLLYPVRRRLTGKNQLKLRGGVTVAALAAEPLLSIFHEVWVERHYAIPGFAAKPGDVIVDIGANVGVFTLWAARRSKGARIISVEPFPATARFLRENLARSGIGNVTVVEACVGGAEREVVLRSRGPAAGNTIYEHDAYGSQLEAIATCKMTTLDRIFADHAIDECALLKLDCEGAEYEILYAASEKTLRAIRNIAMEYHVGMNEHSPPELVQFLREHGFRVELGPLIDEEGGYMIASR